MLSDPSHVGTYRATVRTEMVRALDVGHNESYLWRILGSESASEGSGVTMNIMR